MYAPRKLSSIPPTHRPEARATAPVAVGASSDACRKQFEPDECPVPAQHRLAVCLDYMRTHLDQPLKISTLSALVGLSESWFFMLFRQATRDTPLNWFIRARMERAGELLAQTGLPIKQIAAQVGYADPLYFSRRFKSVHGLPPTEYRVRNQRAAANVVVA